MNYERSDQQLLSSSFQPSAFKLYPYFCLLDFMTQDSQVWYIVKRPAGNCEIITNAQTPEESDSTIQEHWGPFASEDEALARRVGLIRAGKCQPV